MRIVSSLHRFDLRHFRVYFALPPPIGGPFCRVYWRVSCSAAEYGLFLGDDDPRKGIWLENTRNLDYYLLRNGVSYFKRNGKAHKLWDSGRRCAEQFFSGATFRGELVHDQKLC